MSKVVNYTEIKSAESCRYDGMSLGEVQIRLISFVTKFWGG